MGALVPSYEQDSREGKQLAILISNKMLTQ